MTTHHPSRGHAPLDTPKKKKLDPNAARVALEKRVRDLEDVTPGTSASVVELVVIIIFVLGVGFALWGIAHQLDQIRDVISKNCLQSGHSCTYFTK